MIVKNNILIIIGFLTLSSLSFGAFAAAGKSDVITGCYPITLKDAEKFNPPKFEDYKVKEIYKGKIAKPNLKANKDAWYFRTMIREGMAAGVNFAGHYVMSNWGTGTGVRGFAIINAKNGNVYTPPFDMLADNKVGTTGVEPYDKPFKLLQLIGFVKDSNLIITIGTQEYNYISKFQEGIGYYRWTGKDIKLIRFLKSKKEGWCCGKCLDKFK